MTGETTGDWVPHLHDDVRRRGRRRRDRSTTHPHQHGLGHVRIAWAPTVVLLRVAALALAAGSAAWSIRWGWRTVLGS